MASEFTNFFGQGGLWGSLRDLGHDIGSTHRDLWGNDGFFRNWWSGDLGGGDHSNANLRNFSGFVAGDMLGTGVDSETGGSWGRSAVTGLRNLFSSGGGGLGSLAGGGGGIGGLGGMLGGGNTQMPPIDNSMILPTPQQQPNSDMPPGLMTMLLANMFQQQQQRQARPDESPINSGGII